MYNRCRGSAKGGGPLKAAAQGRKMMAKPEEGTELQRFSCVCLSFSE